MTAEAAEMLLWWLLLKMLKAAPATVTAQVAVGMVVAEELPAAA